MADNKGTCVTGFVAGVIVGAAVALLLSPTSGEELRQQLQEEANALRQETERDRARAKSEWEKATRELRDALAETRGQVKAYVQQLQEKRQSNAPPAED